MIEKHNLAGSSCLLNELDTLWIVLSLNFRVTRKGFMVRLVVEELETGIVYRIQFLLPSQILNLDRVFISSPIFLPKAGDGIGIDVLIGAYVIGGWDEESKGSASGGGSGWRSHVV